MRARNIKPGFFRNEQLAECCAFARLLFEGLWCLADREGRLEDRPKRIRADVFPYDDVDVEELLDELAAQKLIVRYAAEGLRCIWIPTFLRHQHPLPKEKASELPQFEEGMAAETTYSDKVHTKVISGSEPDNTLPRTGLSDVLNPDILNPEETPLNPPLSEKAKEQNQDRANVQDCRVASLCAMTDGERNGASRKNRRRDENEAEDHEFVLFWNKYPYMRGSRTKAYRCWQRLVKAGVSTKLLQQAAAKYAAHCFERGLEPDYVLHGSTFLSWKDRRYKEYLPEDDVGAGTGGGQDVKLEDYRLEGGGIDAKAYERARRGLDKPRSGPDGPKVPGSGLDP